ncbi:MAG: hypothetical protein AAGA56_13370, partial [Myxococcota bacterium]
WSLRDADNNVLLDLNGRNEAFSYLRLRHLGSGVWVVTASMDGESVTWQSERSDCTGVMPEDITRIVFLAEFFGGGNDTGGNPPQVAYSVDDVSICP